MAWTLGWGLGADGCDGTPVGVRGSQACASGTPECVGSPAGRFVRELLRSQLWQDGDPPAPPPANPNRGLFLIGAGCSLTGG